jgi:hypothetical protein
MNNTITQDPWNGSYPPARYGQTLAEVANTVEEIVERIFRDEDGILRCSVNSRTMKPYVAEEVTDRKDGIGTFVQHSAIPTDAKPVWMNYENAGQASGVYLEALCAKYKATGDESIRPLAERTVEAIARLWENAANMEYPNGGAGRGWFPKPYFGINNVAGMYECSADQYCDITLGLHCFYETFANNAQKRLIENIITSFAEWWYDHDYCGIYLGKPIWWKRLEGHTVCGWFIYLNALAQSFRPCKKFEDGFNTWRELTGVLTKDESTVWICMNGIPTKSMKRMLELRPDCRDYWLRVTKHQADLMVKSVSQPTNLNRLYVIDPFAADYLATAHEILPNEGYDNWVRKCLEACFNRESYFHLRRGQPVANLSVPEQGQDMIDALLCENHVHWLSGYWISRNLHPQA